MRGERLAAFFDHAGDVFRKLLDIDRARLRRSDRRGRLYRGLLVHAFPVRAVPGLEDFGPWFRHISGINLFEAILTDSLLVVHCGVKLSANDFERATSALGSAGSVVSARMRHDARGLRLLVRRPAGKNGRTSGERTAAVGRNEGLSECVRGAADARGSASERRRAKKA